MQKANAFPTQGIGATLKKKKRWFIHSTQTPDNPLEWLATLLWRCWSGYDPHFFSPVGFVLLYFLRMHGSGKVIQIHNCKVNKSANCVCVCINRCYIQRLKDEDAIQVFSGRFLQIGGALPEERQNFLQKRNLNMPKWEKYTK